MANSRRYIQFKNRIKAIERNLVPPIKPSGNYTKKEQDQIRSYLLLTHAEIEAYLEDIAESKAKSAFTKWKNARTKSNVLLALITFSKKALKGNNIENRVHSALTSFIQSLNQNHGIKETNVLAILLPVGIEKSEIDQTWLNTITSFGKDRGEIAHTTAHVQQPLDPITIKTTIQQITSEIQTIDEKLLKLR